MSERKPSGIISCMLHSYAFDAAREKQVTATLLHTVWHINLFLLHPQKTFPNFGKNKNRKHGTLIIVCWSCPSNSPCLHLWSPHLKISLQ